MKEILLGNEAIAYGAVHAGVRLVSGYPGTPSTEVLQTVAKLNRDHAVHVEWSTNEKAAIEVAAGAAYSGERVMVTMKQVGLNVASDPLMSLAIVGVKGGMVIVTADDPGPISSQTEQDTRHFGNYANIPVLDPCSPEEAYAMVMYAFELSEEIGMPVILRPTTKVCHASAAVELSEERFSRMAEGFKKDSRWVIFPPLSYRRHIEIESQQKKLSAVFDKSRFNALKKGGKLGIAAGGVTSAILEDILDELKLDVTTLKVGAVFPAPSGLYADFLRDVDRALVLEELDPVIEEGLISVKGTLGIMTPVSGKLDGFVCPAGELKYDDVKKLVCRFAGINITVMENETIELPRRVPVLCAACPHRASFYAVKRAMKGRKAVFCGDIGCYTLGNAQPLDMTDTCLCMGAGITIAQGIKRAEPDTQAFAFVGDSTFFASGMTGLANAAYNRSDINVIVLDNSTTAMTGHQPHPGTGKTMMDGESKKLSIEAVARALNAGFVETADPFELDAAIETVKRAAEFEGVSVVIFKAPCAALKKPDTLFKITDCIGCMRCVNELGCPAICVRDNKAVIDATLCGGCGLCAKVCPTKRIGRREQ